MKHNRIILKALCFVMLPVLIALLSSVAVFASDTGLPEGYEADEELNRDLNLNKYGVPVHQFKNVLEDETVDIPDIEVLVEDDYSYDEPYQLSDSVAFRIYNCTTQRTEQIAVAEDGWLKGLRLIRGHAYLITSADEHYIISNYQTVGTPLPRLYVWALTAGDQGVAADGAYDYKTAYTGDNEADYLRNLSEIILHHSDAGFYDPLKYTMQMPVSYDGQAVSGVKFVFTSESEEPVTAVSENGIVQADLTEDVDYTVHVEDDDYDIDTFALAVKDKSEHKYTDEETGTSGYYSRYCYDHTCCQGVNEFRLINKSDNAAAKAKSVQSLRKYKTAAGKENSLATVSGMDFKNLLLLVRSPELQLPDEISGKVYQTSELTLVNPHRWEICKITDTELKVREHLNKEKPVEKVCQLTDDGLKELSFKQPAHDTIEYTVDSMSVYPVVIVFSDKSFEPVKPAKPSATKIIKLTPGKKRMTVRWKKQSNGTAGYQIQYSTSKNFKKGKRIVTVKGAAKTKYVVKKLKSRKRYYVRIRTYKISGRTRLYSQWSAAKSVRVR